MGVSRPRHSRGDRDRECSHFSGRPRLLVLALLAIVGLLGFLVFTVAYPSGDGDVIKAAYVLTTVPGWAIGFGYALSRLSRQRPLAALVGADCALGILADLVFLLHRGPLWPL
jgi:hypothetical protein